MPLWLNLKLEIRARPNGHDTLSPILYFPFRSTNYPVPSSKSRLPTLPNLLQNQEGVLIQSNRTRNRSSFKYLNFHTTVAHTEFRRCHRPSVCRDKSSGRTSLHRMMSFGSNACDRRIDTAMFVVLALARLQRTPVVPVS